MLIKDLYYKIPYDYRPDQLWYKFRCWIWYRYSTVRSRYLPHTWVDRDNLLAHCIFEILSDFIENECSPGNVDWYSDEWNHGKIVVNGEEKFVRNEMQELYDWWHQDYNKKYPEACDSLYENSELHAPVTLFCGDRFDPQFKNQEDAEIWKSNMRGITALETEEEIRLDEMLQRVLNIRGWMWT